MVHALEASEQLPALLAEVWRILVGNGRLLVIVPNRHGLWAARIVRPSVRAIPTPWRNWPASWTVIVSPQPKRRSVVHPPQAPRMGSLGRGLGKNWRPLVPALCRRDHDRERQTSVRDHAAATRALTPVRALLPVAKPMASHPVTGSPCSRRRCP